jgi:uncharacterized protein YdeI (YjbR/CyaY-like superfamily)
MADPSFFPSPALFQAWLDRHHATESECLVGFHKVGTGRPTMRWSDAVDEALCYGWIDGVRRSLDADRYTIRFTPRKPASIWSRVNVAKVERLIADGRMRPAGLAAWARRSAERTGVYSFEREPAVLDAAATGCFRQHDAAWRFFESQPPGYRKLAIHWVTGAKRADTRQRRLDRLVAHSAAGERPPQYAAPGRGKDK